MVRHEEVNFLQVNPQNTSMSTIEQQLLFFKLNNEHPLYAPDSRKAKIQKMNHVWDNVDFELEKVMTSYFKFSYRDICICFIKCFAYKKTSGIWSTQYYRRDFTYYKERFNEATLIKLISYEYILALIGDKFHFVELEDIHDFLDEMFDRW